MKDIKSLRQERAKAIEEARALIDAADTEKRSLTGEESSKYDALIDRSEELRSTIEREERLREAERSLETEAEERDRSAPGEGSALIEQFRSFLKGGSVQQELRDLSQGIDTDGGYLVAPQAFVSDLIKFVDDLVIVRQLATVVQVPAAHSLGYPSLEADPSDADWTTELQTGSTDTAMKLGKREFKPYPLAKRIKVSRQLLRNSAIPAEQLIRDRLGYKFAVTEEKAFMTGDGAQKPLGVFTASADGIPVARDVSDGNTTSSIGADGVINAFYAVKAQYMASGAWVFHRDAVKQLAKLKDGEGQYLWRPALTASAPGQLLGRPLYMSEFAPNTFTTGKYIGIFGDFTHYYIADALNMQMQRLEELYAENNQVGFIARRELDAMPVLPEAFARVTLA